MVQSQPYVSHLGFYEINRKLTGAGVCFVPQVKWQAHLFDAIHSSKFETTIMALICMNMLVMMIQHYGQSGQVDLTMNILL